jgi:DSF synthase
MSVLGVAEAATTTSGGVGVMAGFVQAFLPEGIIGALHGATRRVPAVASSQANTTPRFQNLSVAIEPRHGTYWCHMAPRERPSFTPGLLADLADMQRGLVRMFNDGVPIRYYVLASGLPGIFNLGGDLTVLADRVRARDRDSLVRYARACIDVLYNNAVSFNLPVVTVALVQGDALGGGFEAALSCDVIVAEKGTRFGLPEVLFNLFPGMGAYSFLSRRLGAAAAEKMILSGRIFTAEELHEMNLVQVLAEPQMGEQAARDFIERGSKRHNAQSAIFRAGRRIAPLPFDELRDVTEVWVDAALNLGETDLRKMERLTMAQNRRWTGQPPLAAAE